MSEKKMNPGTEQGQKSELDSVEEALVGSHQEAPGSDEEVPDSEARPDVPGHRSP